MDAICNRTITKKVRDLLDLFILQDSTNDSETKTILQSEFCAKLTPELLIYMCNLRYDTRFPNISLEALSERAARLVNQQPQTEARLITNNNWQTIYQNIETFGTPAYSKDILAIMRELVDSILYLEGNNTSFNVTDLYKGTNQPDILNVLDDLYERTDRLRNLTSENEQNKKTIKKLSMDNAYLQTFIDKKLLSEIAEKFK